MIPSPEQKPSSPPPIPVKEKRSLWVIFPAVIVGLIVSLIILPAWLPGMVSSVAATDQRVFWYLSRATAITAYLVLWLSMVWGLQMTTRLVKIWPGFPPATHLHKFFAIFGLSLGVMHGLLLLGDQYMHFSLVQILIPFANTIYRPTWVGFGQLSLYLWGVILLSFYLRRKIGQKTWRTLHVLTFVTYASVFIHGITSGSDSGTVLMQVIYWITGVVLLFLLAFRLLTASAQKRQPQAIAVCKD